MLAEPTPAALTAWKAALTSWDTWLLALVLVAAVPAFGYRRFRSLQRSSGPDFSVRRKLRIYASTVGTQWLLVLVMLLISRRHGLSLADLGERAGRPRLTLAVTLGLLAIVAVVAALVIPRIRRSPLPALQAALGKLRRISPTLGPEMAAFVVVCLTAGMCEELLYRGWLMGLVRVASGSVWVAVAATSVVFGVGHAYQGIKGMLRTAFIGLQLAVLFVLVDSLVPGQVLHAAVDVVSGFGMAIAVGRLSKAEAEAGVAGSTQDGSVGPPPSGDGASAPPEGSLPG